MILHRAIKREDADYARELQKDARDRSHPLIRPRDAATMMVIDRSRGEPRVLMGKRHASHKFMPGKFVFPGGRVDASDRQMAVADGLPEALETKLQQRIALPSPQRARALALAAVRETFEETGLVLGASASGASGRAPSGVWSDYAAHGFLPDLSRIHFIARAVTPPRRPKRFDTRFFTIDASHIAHRLDGIVGPDSELVELVWQKVSEAAELDIPSIQRTVLNDLAARVALGMSHDLPVPFYREINRRWRRDAL
jgi:8-oxo-dGTP pyrophosphatase MutT (NUDIX family)